MTEIKYSNLLQPRSDGMKYILDEDYVYKSSLFNRTKTLKKGMMSDGATWARDLGALCWKKWYKVEFWIFIIRKILNIIMRKKTAAWFVHDDFCEDPFWDDGYPVTNIVASMIICMILHTDGYRMEAYTWFFPTFLCGGEEIKKVNGWIWIRKIKHD